MASTNVAKFAAELKMPAEALLEQLRAAGVDKREPDDVLTEADKEQLLSALRRAHGADDGESTVNENIGGKNQDQRQQSNPGREKRDRAQDKGEHASQSCHPPFFCEPRVQFGPRA